MAVQLGHVVLRTNRIAAMTAWYCTVLEARVVARRARGVFLTFDACHHRIALVEDACAPEASRLAHVAFAHDSLASLRAAHHRLLAAGISPARAVDHAITASLYYVDPDGNEVELYADGGGEVIAPGTG